MKFVFGLLLLAFLVNSCQGQQVTLTDPILLKAKETSLYSADVDWNKINDTYLELTKGGTTPEELRPGLEFLLNSLGDKHGSFRSAETHALVAYFTGKVATPDNRDPDFVNEVINDISARFSYQLLNDDIGYLKVVAIGPGASIKEDADFIRQGIEDLAGQGVDKWIVDLRTNGGGNMNPMMAGLAPLIGEGFVGGAVDANNDLVREYTIKNGQFIDSELLVCEMPDLPEIDSAEKVAVLLSRYTVSSGELVAVAFKGRENTVFIGEPTGGYTTGNGYDLVADELLMVISQSVFADREMHVYHDRVGVDIPMEFIPTENLKEDAQIKRAVDWLND